MLNLSKYKLILASNSPRRKELLAGLNIDYQLKILPNIDESYPDILPKEEIASYIAQKKAKAYSNYIEENTLLLTADTIVLLGEEVLGKPNDEAEATDMLRKLSGNTHQVITGVCITSRDKQATFCATSEVRFVRLSDAEVDYYVTKYKPFDKAGGYGVQEWIGYIGVEYISGSYFNIMGLPIQRLYQELKKF